MIKITIPFKTPTINHLYGRHRKGFMFVKQKARDLQKKIKEIVQRDTCGLYDIEDVKLKVTVEIHEDWFCKNGSVKIKDICNREKFLIDSVFDALGIDDKYIFEHIMKKIQSTEEKAIIKIEEFKQK